MVHSGPSQRKLFYGCQFRFLMNNIAHIRTNKKNKNFLTKKVEIWTYKHGGKLCLGNIRTTWRTQRVFFRTGFFFIEQEETTVEAPSLCSEHNIRNEEGNGKEITKMSSLSFEIKISKESWSLGRGPQGVYSQGKPLACKTGKAWGKILSHHIIFEVAFITSHQDTLGD